jgi:hypothetical protein
MQTATTTISPLDRVVDMVQLFTAAVEGRVRAPEDRDLEAVVDLTYAAAVDAIRAWGQATTEITYLAGGGAE